MEKINIKIQKSFWEAFLYFLRALRYEKLNFILEDLPIPQALDRKRYLVPTSNKEAVKSWQAFYLFIISFGLFTYYWIVFRNDVAHILKSLLREKEFINKIAQEIPKYSSCKWNYKEIVIYPVVGKWAAARFGKLYIGIAPISLLDERKREIIIHELIHINASEQSKKEIESQLKNWDLADELATVVITRVMQKEVLHTPTHKLQELPSPLGEIGIEKELESLEKVAARKVSFCNLLIYCDKVLSKRIL